MHSTHLNRTLNNQVTSMLYGAYSIQNGKATLTTIGSKEIIAGISKRQPDNLPKLWTTKLTSPLLASIILNQEYELHEFLRLTQSPRHKLQEDEQEQYSDQIINHILNLNKKHGQKAALHFIKRIVTNFTCEHKDQTNPGTEPDSSLLHIIADTILT